MLNKPWVAVLPYLSSLLSLARGPAKTSYEPDSTRAPEQFVEEVNRTRTKATDILNFALGIKAELTETSHRIQGFLDSCRDLEQLLGKVWVAEWPASEDLKSCVADIEARLNVLKNDCTKWKDTWFAKHVAHAQELDRAVEGWHLRITDCWRIYQATLIVEILGLVSMRPEAVTPLLVVPEALPVLEQVVAKSTPSQRADIGAFIDMNTTTLGVHRLTRAERAAIFKALRTMLTVETVPRTVQLSGRVRVIRKATIENRATVIDEGVYKKRAVAIKRVWNNEAKPNRMPKLLYEGAVWRMLYHPNILPFHGIIQRPNGDERYIGLVSDWAPHRDVMSFLAKNPEWDRRRLIKGVSLGIAHVHGLGLVHGGIRGSNILIDRNYHPRLADFSLTSPINKEDGVIGFAPSGTQPIAMVPWLAPELVGDWAPSTASDVFAFGRAIFEIMSGRSPMFIEENSSRMRMISLLDHNSLTPVRPEAGEIYRRGLTDHVWEYLEEMWSREPAGRPDVKCVVTRLSQLWSDE